MNGMLRRAGSIGAMLAGSVMGAAIMASVPAQAAGPSAGSGNCAHDNTGQAAGDCETVTVTVPGPTVTATQTVASTQIVAGPTTTVTQAGPTVTTTVPGPTQTVTVTETVPGPTQTVTVTETVPGPTQTVTETATETVTVPGPTSTVTQQVAGPVTTVHDTVTETATASASSSVINDPPAPATSTHTPSTHAQVNRPLPVALASGGLALTGLPIALQLAIAFGIALAGVISLFFSRKTLAVRKH
jgi:hypothetical protein